MDVGTGMSMQYSLGEQVRAGRTKKRWTRGRLAEEVQATPAEIAAIEMSAQEASSELLRRIASALGISLEGVRRAGPPRPAALPRAALRTALGKGSAMAETEGTNDAAPAATTTALESEAPATAAPPPTAAAPARARTAAAPRITTSPSTNAPSAREQQVIALLERVARARFVYQDGQAWLLRAEEGLAAETPLLAAYALLTECLLAEDQSLSASERAELRRLHHSLYDVRAPRDGATSRTGRLQRR
jgi:transcriptional regulator with XRE-family HTH domain